MTTATVSSRASALGPVAERGRTTVADRAVERIAAQALTEVDGVGGTAPRVLGVAVADAGPDRTAAVTAHVYGDTATLTVRLSVAYPHSVGQTTEHARTHLMRRVEQLTGLAVTRVAIKVTALHGAVASVRRVE